MEKRSGNRWLRLGDKNTRFFHASANGRKNKNFIGILCRDDGTEIEQQQLEGEIFTYFKDLIGEQVQGPPFDLTGRVVLSQTINGQTLVNANELPAGVYNACVSTTDKQTNRKIVIVK